MTITVEKRNRGDDSFGPNGGSLFYTARSDDPDNDDFIDVLNAVVAEAPSTYNTIMLNGVKANEVLRTDNAAGWICEARYGGGGAFATAPPLDRPAYRMSLATEKMIRSKSVVTSAVSGGDPAPSRDNLIRINSDGQPEGTDVLRPVFTFAYTATLTDTQVESTYEAAWLAAAGTVNSATYKGYAAGTLLFQDLAAEPRTQGGYNVRIEFGYRPNETSIDIGDGMTLASLQGWDYLDINPEPSFDDTIDAVIAVAGSYYVHRLYDRVSWGDLGV